MTNRERQIQHFNAVLDELRELHAKKARDYGTDEDNYANVRAGTVWGVPAWVSAMIRLNDKVLRLQSLARTGHLENEGAIDSFNDIAIYSVIARELYEEAIAAPAQTSATVPASSAHSAAS